MVFNLLRLGIHQLLLANGPTIPVATQPRSDTGEQIARGIVQVRIRQGDNGRVQFRIGDYLGGIRGFDVTGCHVYTSHTIRLGFYTFYYIREAVETGEASFDWSRHRRKTGIAVL